MLSDADLDALADRIVEKLRGKKVDEVVEEDDERLPVTAESLKRAADRMARPRKVRMR